jgi:hypothetical protein
MLLATLLLLTTTPAHADVDLPRVNDVLEMSAAAAPLRESTPDALFGGKAAQIGWIRKGESVKVLEARQYLSIFGLEIWLEVQKTDDATVHGWVYDGMSKEIIKGKSNFVIAKRPEEAKPAAAVAAAAPAPAAPVDPKAAAAAEAAKKADALIQDIE